MTNRRSHLILVGLILAALAGVVALGVPGSPIHKKVTLGLDLQGGLEVVLEAKPTKGQKLDSSALDRSVSIMRQRVDKLGVAEPEIRKQGANQIVIELAGVHDPAKAASIIGKTAQLELYDLETSVTGPSLTAAGNPQEARSLYGLLSASQTQALAKSGQPDGYYAFGKNKVKSVGPASTRAAALQQAKQAKLKRPFTVLALPKNTVVTTCDSSEVVCPGNLPQQGNSIPPPPSGRSYYYLFINNPDLKKVDDVKGVPELTGSDLKLSGTRQDFDPTTNEPVVLMQFTGSGSHKFQEVTSEEYNRGRNRNSLPQHFAIVLDREIRSFPQIDPTKSDLAGGISGNAEISGIGSIGEAKDLALVLQTGALPVNFVQIERTDISATLGKDSLSEAKKAALIGLLLVAVFLLVLYRFLGLVAVIGLVTAVAATRAMLGLLSGFAWFDNPRFMGAAGQQSAKWLQIDFMRRRYLWFAISGVIVVIGAASLGAKGLNLGIDFKGGTQVTFKTPKPVSLTDVRNQAKDIGQPDAVIQGRGKTFGSESYENFQMRMKSLTSAEQNKLDQDLSSQFQAANRQITNVSSSFGRQIARSAIVAVIVSLLLIVLYITVRFGLKFSGPVIAALVHDIVITVGVYSLTGREVSNATVAAVLTVLGYSIYDTIIIFDRIRENIPLMRRSSFATIANVSLWETIRRSLATTFITLLPIAALFIFGGATLKDFAFALLVGIVSGAYSSIFIAAPLLTILKEREPEFARRKDVKVDGDGRAAEVVLEQAEEAAAAEPAPDLSPVDAIERVAAEAKRERRRQRRRARPHGRAR